MNNKELAARLLEDDPETTGKVDPRPVNVNDPDKPKPDRISIESKLEVGAKVKVKSTASSFPGAVGVVKLVNGGLYTVELDNKNKDTHTYPIADLEVKVEEAVQSNVRPAPEAFHAEQITADSKVWFKDGKGQKLLAKVTRLSPDGKSAALEIIGTDPLVATPPGSEPLVGQPVLDVPVKDLKLYDKNFQEGKADTFPCPDCGTKVLKNSGYCVKCKSKVKESTRSRALAMVEGCLLDDDDDAPADEPAPEEPPKKDEPPLVEPGSISDKEIDDQIIQFFKDNPNPDDKKVHALATAMALEPDQFENKVYALMSSFFSEGRSKNFKGDYDPEQLKMGIEVEKEHTTNDFIAARIAKDHLAEIPDYYTRLAKMEADAQSGSEKPEEPAEK